MRWLTQEDRRDGKTASSLVIYLKDKIDNSRDFAWEGIASSTSDLCGVVISYQRFPSLSYFLTCELVYEEVNEGVIIVGGVISYLRCVLSHSLCLGRTD